MPGRRWQLNLPIAQGNLCDTFRSVRTCLLFAQLGSCTVPGNLDGKRTAYLTSPQGIKKFVAAIDNPVVFCAHQHLNLWMSRFIEQLKEVSLSIQGTDLTDRRHLRG